MSIWNTLRQRSNIDNSFLDNRRNKGNEPIETGPDVHMYLGICRMNLPGYQEILVEIVPFGSAAAGISVMEHRSGNSKWEQWLGTFNLPAERSNGLDKRRHSSQRERDLPQINAKLPKNQEKLLQEYFHSFLFGSEVDKPSA